MPAWLSSRLLTDAGVPLHGFSTAAAGDMKHAAARLLPASDVPLATARQVHGARAIWAEPFTSVEADALLARPGLAVGVFTADCVPLLLADPEAKLVAAVHAGWRGTIAGVAAVAVRELVEAGARPAALRAAIGPHIRPCCYEVAEDLAARFVAVFGASVVVRSPGPRLDLAAANVKLLCELGLREAHVEILEPCTACSREPRFYSYRREKELSGRQLSMIALR